MEALRALAVLAEAPAPEHETIAEALDLGPRPSPEEHAACFLFRFPPFASFYLGPEGMLGGIARDRIAGFWRALGIEPPAEPDDLVILLASYARLAEEEADASSADRRHRLRHVRGVFLHEHLLSWLPVVAARMVEIAPPFYQRWAALVLEALAAEASSLSEHRSLPAHLREAPDAPDFETLGADDLLQWLLAPVRSGILLVRDDLARTAGAAGHAVRPGERRTMLRALLAEDPAGTLRWLAAEARRQASLHRSRSFVATRWWADRAAATATQLEALAGGLEPVTPEARALPSAR